MARMTMATVINVIAIVTLVNVIAISIRRRRQAKQDETAAVNKSIVIPTSPTPSAPPLQTAGATTAIPSSPTSTLCVDPISLPGMTRMTQTHELRPSLPTVLTFINPRLASRTPGLMSLETITPPVPTRIPSIKQPHSAPSRSKTPDLILRKLPIELELQIMSYLSILDLTSIRDTCRTWKWLVDLDILKKALMMQNIAGWTIVFEFQGQKYPSTRYENRRLCGSCLRPKPRAHIIDGAVVADYLTRRRVDRRDPWDVNMGMCWPCLWLSLVKGGNDLYIGSDVGSDVGEVTAITSPAIVVGETAVDDVPMWKRANIAHTEEFKMLDNSSRKPCESCAKDIHTNEVPCQYCTDFTQWLRDRNSCAKVAV